MTLNSISELTLKLLATNLSSCILGGETATVAPYGETSQMDDSPNSEEIIDALRKSGYLMEQEVASQLEAFDFHVFPNQAFEDIEEGKSREIDVVARKRVAHSEESKLSAFVEIVAECKNNTNPFIFIGRPKNQTDNLRAPQEYVFPLESYEAQEEPGTIRRRTSYKSPFFHLGFDKVHYDYAKDMKAVQFCRIYRKGKEWQANHGGLYDSIFYPIAKAVTSSKQEQVDFNRSSDWGCFWFIFPMVIVSGDIYYVDSTIPNPVPESRGHVNFKRQIQSEKLNGVFAVDFVRQDQIGAFVSDCLNPLASKVADLVTDHANFVWKRSIPWEE